MLWKISFKTFLCFHVNVLAPIFAFTVKLGMFIFSLNVILFLFVNIMQIWPCFGLFYLILFFGITWEVKVNALCESKLLKYQEGESRMYAQIL